MIQNMFRLPEPQRAAMAWLPVDGSWRTQPNPQQVYGLQQLMFFKPPIVERNVGPYGENGAPIVRWRLTRRGVLLRGPDVVENYRITQVDALESAAKILGKLLSASLGDVEMPKAYWDEIHITQKKILAFVDAGEKV